MNTQIAVSVLSLRPYSLGPGGLFRSLSRAKRAHIEYLELAPLFGYTPYEMHKFALRAPGAVVSFGGGIKKKLSRMAAFFPKALPINAHRNRQVLAALLPNHYQEYTAGNQLLIDTLAIRQACEPRKLPLVLDALATLSIHHGIGIVRYHEDNIHDLEEFLKEDDDPAALILKAATCSGDKNVDIMIPSSWSSFRDLFLLDWVNGRIRHLLN